MAKASDNPFPSILVAETAAPAAPPAGYQRLFIDPADHKVKREDSSGTVTTVEGGTGGSSGGVLASTSWFPASNTDALSTSATYADVNATNAAVTFTAPASGAVIVTANFSYQVGTATVLMVDLREGTTDLTNTATRVGYLNLPGITGASSQLRGTVRWKITGLTSGSSHTYKLGLARASGTDTAGISAGPAWGALEMDVVSA